MKQRYKLFTIIFLCALGLGALLTLFSGETPWSIVYQGIIDRWQGTSKAWNPLLDERLPRLIVILCTGSSLAVSGAVMQALFQNPLASPSVLGISSGGCLFVIVLIILGWQHDYPFAVPLAAFLGCITTLLLVYSLTHWRGQGDMRDLLLTGIAVSTLLIAVQGTLMYALRDRWELMQTLTEWEAGSTLDRNWKHVHMQLPVTSLGLLGCLVYRSEIDLLSLGGEEALHLGVDVEKIRWRLFLCVSLLTGGAVAAVGMIPFFGLILPHVARWMSGPSHRRLIPICILGGAATLAFIDLFLRSLQLHAFSIGNVSALFGSLFFILLLTQNTRRQESHAGN